MTSFNPLALGLYTFSSAQQCANSIADTQADRLLVTPLLELQKGIQHHGINDDPTLISLNEEIDAFVAACTKNPSGDHTKLFRNIVVPLWNMPRTQWREIKRAVTPLLKSRGNPLPDLETMAALGDLQIAKRDPSMVRRLPQDASPLAKALVWIFYERLPIVLEMDGRSYVLNVILPDGKMILCQADAMQNSGTPKDYLILDPYQILSHFRFKRYVPKRYADAHYSTVLDSKNPILNHLQNISWEEFSRIFKKPDDPFQITGNGKGWPLGLCAIPLGDELLPFLNGHEWELSTREGLSLNFHSSKEWNGEPLFSPAKFLGFFNNLPPSLTSGLREIFFVANDTEGGAIYNDDKIVFMKDSAGLSDWDFLIALLHELLHHFESRGFVGTFSMNTPWLAAMVQEGQSVSEYAQTTIREDFAETGVLYLLTAGGTLNPKARMQFPHRFAILDDLLQEVFVPNGI